MASRTKLTDTATLGLYSTALENVGTQPQIAAVMAELGFDSAAIARGQTLLDETKAIYYANMTEKHQTSVAYAGYSDKKRQLGDIFKIHREKAKIVFRKDLLVANRLAISGSMPRTYIKWIEVVKKFYSVASTDIEIQNKLSRLKISVDDLNTTRSLITDLETAKIKYIREKGESQNATQVKNAAFYKIDDWMSEFYAVAKIGLKDNPQLLETLGKTVKRQ